MATASDDDYSRLYTVSGDGVIIWADPERFMRDHGVMAIRTDRGNTQFLVYDEDGGLVWVGEESLERQTTADIKAVSTKKPS